jgi:DNA-binding transcriptional LysR family regulator
MIMRPHQTLDLQALRTFVLGMELNNFALAAKQLCRSTSAVSAQLKKLESQTGLTLVQKQGRHLLPTSSGEQLLSYAKRLLTLNDEAIQTLQVPALCGKLHFAMQEDFGESFLTQLLGRFSHIHHQIQLSTTVTRNAALISGIQQGQFDLALSWGGAQHTTYEERLTSVPLQWFAHENFAPEPYLDRNRPLPLIMFDIPCLIRDRATQTLDNAGIPWQVIYVSHSLSGIRAAVEAGLGITVRTRIGMPPKLQPIKTCLPELGELDIVMHRANCHASPQVARLAENIREQIDTIQ